MLTGGTLSDSSKECRVNGVLMTTRGLGNHGDKKLKKCVLVEPYTTSVPIDQYAQFLVLATRGVWEVFSENEVASLLIKVRKGYSNCCLMEGCALKIKNGHVVNVKDSYIYILQNIFKLLVTKIK